MLDRVLLFAAQVADGVPEGLPQQQEVSNLFGLSLRDVLLLVAVAIIIGLTLFLWAYLTRRERRRHLARSPVFARDPHQRSSQEAEDRSRMRRRRRRQPERVKRNPTLGETGGLPPIRPDEPARPTV
jgi:hypothetical protein